MPPDVYKHTRDKLLVLLREHFQLAESPTQGPEKPDFGDVDILVYGPMDSATSFPESDHLDIITLGEILKAKAYKDIKGTSTLYFAVPWPKRLSAYWVSNESSSSAHTEHTTSPQPKDICSEPALMSSPETQTWYIQVDITLCKTPKLFHWERFTQAHGDLGNILGQMIRKYGLTINNTGLHIRMEELELWSKDKSRVFITDNPGNVLRFLELETDSK